jgi:hypothetical protein
MTPYKKDSDPNSLFTTFKPLWCCPMQLNLNLEFDEGLTDYYHLADRQSKATKHKLPIEVKHKGFVLL